jgi:flagellar biosynthesis GTPase FlhF
MSDADKALIPQALQLIREKPLRNFRIDIAADSLVQIDEAQEKQDRLQFLQAFGGFLQQALPVGQASPELVPVMMDLLKYGVQAFKAARPLEGTIDAATEQLKQIAAQPRENPAALQAQMEAQAEQAKAQADMQMESQKVQMQGQLEQAKLQMQMQIEQMKAQTQMQIEQQRQSIEAQIEKYKADLDARTRLQIAQIEAVSETNLGVGNGPAN